MFCGKCGKQTPDNANACGYCGFRFSDYANQDQPTNADRRPVTPQYTPSTPTRQPASPKKKNKGNGKFIMAGAILGLVIAVAGSAIAYNFMSPDTTTEVSTDDNELIITDYKNKDDDKAVGKKKDKPANDKDDSETEIKSEKEQKTEKESEPEKEQESKKKQESKPEQEIAKEPEPEETTPAISTYNDQMNDFLGRAQVIENYEYENLTQATTQKQMNTESAIVFEKWDVLLNDVYRYLETILPAGEFAALEEDEIAWIIEKENAIDAAGSEWEGGSMEPFARNSTAIRYTEERCYYLISLIN